MAHYLLVLRAMEDVEMAAQSKDMRRLLISFIHAFILPKPSLHLAMSPSVKQKYHFLPNAQNGRDLTIK